jgi:hypothetical protein
MASAAITIPQNANAGATLRRLAFQIQQAAAAMPDNVVGGSSTVLTINDTPGGNAIASVQVTGGPFAGAALLV